MHCNRSRITFLIGSMRRGGAERVISLLANNYALRGWEVDILTFLDDIVDYKLDERISVISLANEGKSRAKQLPRWIYSIRKHIKDSNPDTIVSFIARINILAILSTMGLKKRIIVSERNDPLADGRSAVVNILTSLLYPYSEGIVFQTEWAKSCFKRKIQDKSYIIQNPIHVTSYKASMAEKKIVAVGRLEEQKNHSLLIKAFNKISKLYPEYKLFIYGEGTLRGKIIEEVNSLGLSDSVFLPGNIQNIHEEIRDSEIFVLSSNYEGLSNALLEAMMMGLPCISTQCAGSNEVIKDGYNGLLVPIKDEEKLFNALKLLISNQALREKISNASIETAKDFDMGCVVKKWEEVIESGRA